MNGHVSIDDPDGFLTTEYSEAGDTCVGAAGYDEVAKGAQVVISDDAGKTLAIAHLDAGTTAEDESSCLFSFAATVPAGLKFYGFTLTHRGTVKQEESQLSNVQLSLG